MEKCDVEKDTMDHTLKIIANHHSARDIDTPEFRIVWDADWLTNIPDELENLSQDKLKETIEKIFKTETGKKKAYQLFLSPYSRLS